MSTARFEGLPLQGSPRPGSARKIRVHEAESRDYARWDDFVSHCPEATFFHRAGWKRVIEEVFSHRTYFLYAEAGGEIEGVLPLAEIKSAFFGHKLVSLPFCVYGGTAARTDEAARALDDAARALADLRCVDLLEYRSMRPRHPSWQHRDLYVTFRKTLHAEVERNMLDIPRKQRAMVRKGMKAGLTSSIDEDTVDFYRAYAESVHRLGTPVFSRAYFRKLREVFGRDCEILTVRRGGKVVAAVMSFYFRDEVLPYYGGGTAAARELAGNDFMYWEVMRRACERGIRVFDYGRSKQGTGSFAFKKNWGFEPTPLVYEYLLVKGRHVPEHNPLNPRYRHFIKAWQRMPLALANAIGPHIVRGLG
ncbi:MAG: FemAB family XrtA/PEP-CTERM system-associated protein [Rhodospirillaceae bacterium]